MKIPQLVLVLISSVVISCNSSSEDKEITTDLINSPLTANQSAEKVLTPKIQMDKESYNFGEIQQGESVTHNFVLKNIGDASLIISSAKGSCGCTVPEWPKEPIVKAEEAIIKVTFDSAGKSGKQNKTVTLVTNAIPNTKVITITGTVIVPEKK